MNQVKVLAAENEKLKGELNKMREEGFEADAAKEQAEMAKKESSIWQRRLQNKEERLRVLEKRLNELARSKGSAVSRCIAFSS
jgi:outer membrane murein-binding lipoprotein Lpp